MLSAYINSENAITQAQENDHLLPFRGQSVASLIHFDSAVQNRTLCQAHRG